MDINKILNIQKKIVPETIDLLIKRYEILKIISSEHPIGRRALSNKLGITERSMRTEIEKLNEINLISIHSSGVELTLEGATMLSEVQETFY
jgi:central glycolytic genes regulator